MKFSLDLLVEEAAIGATFVVHAFSCAPNNSVMINNSHIKGLQTHVLHNKKVSNGCLSGVQGGGGVHCKQGQSNLHTF